MPYVSVLVVTIGICLTVVGNWERRKDNKVIRPYTVDLKYRGTRVPEADAALNDQERTDDYWSNVLAFYTH